MYLTNLYFIAGIIWDFHFFTSSAPSIDATFFRSSSFGNIELRFAFSPILSIWNIRGNPDENSCASPRDRVSVIGSSPIPLLEAWKPVTKWVESFLKTEQTFSYSDRHISTTSYLRIIMRHVLQQVCERSG